MNVTGRWQLDIRTPIGRQTGTLELTETESGLAGMARGETGDVALRDLALDGDRLTWAQSITRPMKLDLRFDVLVTGDALSGTAKAGRLPASKVTGTRISAHPESASGT
ncbi:hypothetical protein ACFWY9_19165 [Amycolatopsis sp. NPDC059027]|uniref:hypothetical protein n=1 Tax=unclassified Amycolatopsis TaxID=2618356 RepID=UPI003673134F